MKPPRSELRRRQKAVRRWLREQKRRAREKLLRVPLVRQRRERRRRLWGLGVLLLAVLVLFHECDCEGTRRVAEIPKPQPPTPTTPAPTKANGHPPRKADAETLYLPRDTMVEAPGRTAPWLSAFRMQVAARGPRLGSCFEGSREPGALRWSAAIDPGSGVVSEHTLTPLQESVALRAPQKRCLLEVLSKPPYALPDVAATEATPRRVSIVVEF